MSAARQARCLRIAFAVGAVTDAVALLPMLIPRLANVLWGVDTSAPILSTGYGASLMTGWTGLLLWAYRRPVQRRFVAPLTILVVLGLVATEVLAVHAGDITLSRMVPTFVLQAVLCGLLGAGYRDAAAAAAGRGRAPI